MNDTTHERQGLIIITAMIVIALLLVAAFATFNGIDANGATVVGVIVSGLIAFGKDIVQALRGYSMSAQLSKVTDQLAASAPGTTPALKEAGDAAQDTADAAQQTADQIKGAG